MQTTNTALNKAATTANIMSSTPPPTQQPGTPPPAAAPPTSSSPHPGVDPELLEIADDLAPKLKECVVNSLGWRIMLGRRLREYREQMSRNDWVRILVSRRLGAGSPRRVQMLVRVGGQKVFRDSSKLALIPDCVTVLNELAGLPAQVLEQALSAGTINCEMSLKQAKHFIREWRGRCAAEDSNPQHQETIALRRLAASLPFSKFRLCKPRQMRIQFQGNNRLYPLYG